MILRNWANWASLRGTAYHRYKTTSGRIVIVNSSSRAFELVAKCNDYYSGGNGSVSFNYIGIAFGSGTTAPTVNDYKLETPITKLTSLSATNNIRQSGVYANDYQIEATQSVKNGTESNITISEIVLFAGNAGGTVIFARNVITPVTLAPNESKTFVVSVNFEELSTQVQST